MSVMILSDYWQLMLSMIDCKMLVEFCDFPLGRGCGDKITKKGKGTYEIKDICNVKVF